MATKDKENKPAVMITGAAGALAQQVIKRLRNHYTIVAVDFREQVYLSDNIASYRIDVNKRGFEDIFRRHKIQADVHLGLMISSEENRMRRYNSNVIGTHRLLDLCHKYKIRKVVILSTYHVYGANAYNPALLDESAPLKAAELTMDLIDSVELENLANIYLWRYPDLNITVLRPCNIVGPGVKNTISNLLSNQYSPALAGFSPMMQFIHIDDIATAITLAAMAKQGGIYNVANDDWVAYQEALSASSCHKIPLPSIPPVLPRIICSTLRLKTFPTYLINYFKYPVIIDGTLFNSTYSFKPQYSLSEIFRYYRSIKT